MLLSESEASYEYENEEEYEVEFEVEIEEEIEEPRAMDKWKKGGDNEEGGAGSCVTVVGNFGAPPANTHGKVGICYTYRMWQRCDTCASLPVQQLLSSRDLDLLDIFRRQYVCCCRLMKYMR